MDCGTHIFVESTVKIEISLPYVWMKLKKKNI